MSRLTDKIEKVQKQVNELQDYLEELENKQYKRGAKKRKKQWRKQYANSYVFRMKHHIYVDFEKTLYGYYSNPSEFTGIMDYLKKV